VVPGVPSRLSSLGGGPLNLDSEIAARDSHLSDGLLPCQDSGRSRTIRQGNRPLPGKMDSLCKTPPRSAVARHGGPHITTTSGLTRPTFMEVAKERRFAEPAMALSNQSALRPYATRTPAVLIRMTRPTPIPPVMSFHFLGLRLQVTRPTENSSVCRITSGSPNRCRRSGSFV
jgi:hypothetical protein